MTDTIKYISCGILFVFLMITVTAGCNLTGSDDGGNTKMLTISNRSSVTLKDIKWSDEVFTGSAGTKLTPNGTVANMVNTTKAEGGKGYLFFNSTSDVAFRTREVVSFFDRDTFTFTDNTIVVELNYTANIGTLANVMSIPLNIRLSAGIGSITASWSEVEGASSYNVYYGTSETPPENPAQTTSETSAVITGLYDARTYYVWVQSVRSGNVSALSRTASLTTPAVYEAGTAGAFGQAIIAINDDVTGLYAIRITGSFSTSPVAFAVNAIKTIIIEGDSANHSIYNDGNIELFTVPGDITLILGNNITINGNNKSVPAIGIQSGGSLVMNDGSTITGAKLRGVFVDGGEFAMTGGSITGNSVAPAPGALITYCMGGGVCVKNGNFVMSGGTISNNSVYANISDPGISAYCYGGGVVLLDSSFTMTGGVISGNSVFDSRFNSEGGGVYVGGRYLGGSGNSSFTMTGGAVSGNSSSTFGGGVYIESGIFIMNNGTISGNSASSSGGGVYVGNGAFVMKGGLISSNSAVKFVGGGVAATGAFSKTGGTIDAANSAQEGKVAYAGEYRKRNSTAGSEVNMDSSIAGSAGGWE
jgi:hypothetical protein